MPEYFVHPQAICDSKKVGAGTRVWAFVHVFEGAVIGGEEAFGEAGTDEEFGRARRSGRELFDE